MEILIPRGFTLVYGIKSFKRRRKYEIISRSTIRQGQNIHVFNALVSRKKCNATVKYKIGL
jgi:hypothetical protein